MLNLSVKRDIKEAKGIINDSDKTKRFRYLKYSVIPIRGTENSRELFSQLECSFDKSLMVAGSGDQILEAIFNGAKEIYSFDINKLTKYGNDLKFAAIAALDYEEYISFYVDLFPDELYYKVRDFLNGDSLIFWDSIFNYCSNLVIFDRLFDTDHHSKITNSCFSVNLKESFYKIKEQIFKVSIIFTRCNLENISYQYLSSQQYDFIYLSNIYYYLHKNPKEFSKLIKKSILPLLNKNGEALIHYLYGAGDVSGILEFMNGILCTDNGEQLSRKELHKYLNLTEYITEATRYGRPISDKDLVLSLKKKDNLKEGKENDL